MPEIYVASPDDDAGGLAARAAAPETVNVSLADPTVNAELPAVTRPIVRKAVARVNVTSSRSPAKTCTSDLLTLSKPRSSADTAYASGTTPRIEKRPRASVFVEYDPDGEAAAIATFASGAPL